MRMGLREANQNFSKAIKAVKAGKQIVLTERGTPIAVIQPLKPLSSEKQAIQSMIDSGFLRPAEEQGPMPDWKPLRIKGVSLSKTLREDRDKDYLVVTPSAYLDTSVLVKRSIRDQGSTQPGIRQRS